MPRFEHDLAERHRRLEDREGVLDRREAELPRLRTKALEEARKEGQTRGYDEGRAAAQRRADEVMKVWLAQLRASAPALVDDFLDRKDSKGRSYRPIFERYVNERIQQFEIDHDVTGRLELEPGDRETFIEDGGAQLAEEVARLQHQRTVGD